MNEKVAVVGNHEAQTQWVKGRNGGRLRVGGVSRGPNRATVLVRQGVAAALRDQRGGAGKEFWVGLKTGSPEDRRTFANIAARLIPVEVQGELSESLTVVVKTLVSEDYAMEGVVLPIINSQSEQG